MSIIRTESARGLFRYRITVITVPFEGKNLGSIPSTGVHFKTMYTPRGQKETMKNSEITYKELQEEGLISQMERKVADFVKLHGPCSGNDIDEIISGGHKRLASLERKGIIEAVADIRDVRTKRMTTVYRYVMNPRISKIIEAKNKKEKKITTEHISAIYDDAFRRGVMATIETLFPESNYFYKQNVAQGIIERLQE